MEALVILWTIFFIGAVSMFLRFLNQVWLKPRRIRSALSKQGVRGPQLSFLFGNIAEMEKHIHNVTKKVSKGRDVRHDWAPSVHPFLHKWVKDYGSVFMYSTGTLQHLVISDPDLVREIRTRNAVDLGRPTYLNKTFYALTGNGIFLTNGEKWAYQRKSIAPEFFHDKVKDMLDIMTEFASATAKRWERRIQESGSGVVDMTIDEDLSTIAKQIVSKACFNWSFSEIGDQLYGNIAKLRGVFAAPSFFFGFLNFRLFPTAKDKMVMSARKEMDDMILKLVGDRLAQMRQDGASKKDLLHTILESAYSPEKPAQLPTDDFILDACKSMYFAGVESTAVASVWTLMFLSLHQEWQERVRDEIVEVCGDQDIQQCLQHKDTLPKLKTLTMVIQESMRLYPPSAINGKEALENMKLGNLNVPKGTIVWVFIPRLHYDPENWGPDADEFKPERFANGVSKSCKYPAAYAPFGIGTRICLGQNFAMAQIKIVLSVLLSKFSFSISPNYEHCPKYGMTLNPGHGMRLLVSPIQAKVN